MGDGFFWQTQFFECLKSRLFKIAEIYDDVWMSNLAV